MSRGLPFAKVSGAGNDFVVIDNRRSAVRQSLPALARQLCDRRSGIGADGLLVAERSRQADVRMRIFNPDGSEPEMCGNGARGFALYAHAQGWTRAAFQLEIKAGVLAVRVAGHRVRLEMPQPSRFGRETLRVDGRALQVYRASIGNPHAVIIVPRVNRVDVAGLGRHIRWHRRFAPAGVNVNFVELGRSVVRIRTYERGVEGETPACGSGATAAAAVLWCYRNRRSPVTLLTRSGDRLRVHLTVAQDVIQRAVLDGPARIVFTGTWTSGRR